MNRQLRYLALAVALPFIACGGDDDDSTGPSLNVLLSANVILTSGVTCDNGGVTKEFTGTAGKTVIVTASGTSTMTPVMTLYAPDYATQLASSSSTGAGKAAFTEALTQTGTHFLSICDVNGVGGSVKVVVTEQ